MIGKSRFMENITIFQQVNHHNLMGKSPFMERSAISLWENSLSLWPCSIAILNYQRVEMVDTSNGNSASTCLKHPEKQ